VIILIYPNLWYSKNLVSWE